MTTLPLTPRNTPLTPTRIVEALCAARPDEAQLGERQEYRDYLTGTPYTARLLSFDGGPGMEQAGLLILDAPLPHSGAYHQEWMGDTGNAVNQLFMGLRDRCWEDGIRLTLVCEPCGPTSGLYTPDVKAILQDQRGGLGMTTAVATTPSVAVLLAYAQMVSGLQIGEEWR